MTFTNQKAVPSFLQSLCKTGIIIAAFSGYSLTAEDTFSSLQGHWKWQGYNRILSISEKGYSLKARSAISCLAYDDGADLAEQFDRLVLDGANRFTAYDKGGINKYRFTRMPTLPATCEESVKDGPEHIFEVFWRYFDENYAFFKTHNIDWTARYAEYRPKVNSYTSDEALFQIFSDMLTGFNDGHVGVLAGPFESLYDPESNVPYFNAGMPAASQLVLKDMFEAQKDNPDAVKSENAHQFTVLRDINEHLKSNLLKGQYHSAANELILWGEISPGIGYFAVHAMSSLFSTPGTVTANDDVIGVSKILDTQIIPFLSNKKAVVLDVRFNGGGYDAVSLAIASRFADRERLAFSKKAQDKEGFAPAQEIYFAPQGPAQYTKPVYLLTSSLTASAADIFTMSMMTLPHITRVGMPTQGILSDMWIAPLPNGWLVSLSNEVYLAADGTSYEGVGVPVQVEAPVFVRSAFWENIDKATDAAHALIQ